MGSPTKLFFDNVDAGSAQTSDEFSVPCGQDMRWFIQVDSTGLDGTPQLFLEISTDGTVWNKKFDPITCFNYWDLDNTDVVGIEDSYFVADRMRLRLEPNGNTTGTVWAKMNYKTKV